MSWPNSLHVLKWKVGQHYWITTSLQISNNVPLQPQVYNISLPNNLGKGILQSIIPQKCAKQIDKVYTLDFENREILDRENFSKTSQKIEVRCAIGILQTIDAQ